MLPSLNEEATEWATCMSREPTFEIAVPPDVTPDETVVVGVADVSVAGLTAVDYLVSHLTTDQIGHVETQNVPDITPFSEGRPRHPMRLYDVRETNLTVFISEVFLPVWTADQVADALFDWIRTTDESEIVVLFGAPFPHADEEHDVFYVGTDAFRERHVADSEIEPLAGGFFDGVVGELVTRGLQPDAPPTGVLVTPAHYPGPDLDGALRLLDGFESVFDVAIDEAELLERSEDLKQYYQELSDRMQTLQGGDQAGLGKEYPDNRMFM